MRRLGFVAFAAVAALSGCEAAVRFGAAIFNLGLLVVVLAAVVEGGRRLVDPARHDPAVRALTEAARRLRLPMPRRARRLAWPLSSGLEAKAEADVHLELSVALREHLPATLVVDRPSLPPGIGLSRVLLPDGLLSDFFVLGSEADAFGVLSYEVRRALLAASAAPLHVAIEQGALRVRLDLSAGDLADEAARQLDAVARAVVKRPTDPAARLAAFVMDDAEPRALRARALGSLLESFPDAEATHEVAARAGDLDPDHLRRWAGRHGRGALSLSEAPAPQGGVALADDAAGGLSDPD